MKICKLVPQGKPDGGNPHARCAWTALFAFAAFSCAADVVTNQWNGAAGTVDWTDASKWSRQEQPTADQVVVFLSGENERSGVFAVTPPENFTGTILITNAVNEQSHMTYVRLSPGDDAQWTIAGDGVVIATNGIAARCSNEFVGAISIPAGQTFAPTASMSDAVSFIGDGRLDLTACAGRFASSFGGFHGTVALSADTVVSNVASILNAELELPKGGAVSLPEHALAYGGTVEIPDWTDTSAWTFNGTTYATSQFPQHPFNAQPPAVDADGSLTLTDDPAQLHSVIYKGHVFSRTEDWGVEFTYEPSLPQNKDYFGEGTEKNHCFGGWFGFVLQPIGPNAVGESFDSPLTGQCGFNIYHYQNKFSVRYQGDKSFRFYFDAARDMNGITFEKSLRMKVAFVGNVMTMTLMQDGKSFSLRKSYVGMQTGAYYIGFVGASESNGSASMTGNIYWVRERVRDFKGWYRSRKAGGWRDVANESDYSAFDANSWFMRKIDMTQSPAVTNDGNACVSADGSLVLNDTDGSGKYSGRAISKKTLSRNSRYLFSFDLDYGKSGTSRGNGWAFGFCKLSCENATFNKYNGSLEFGSSIDRNWAYGASWTHCPYVQNFVAACLASYTFGEKKKTSDTIVKVVDNHKSHYDAFYDPIDGLQGLDVSVTNSSPTATQSGSSGSFDYEWPADQLATYRAATPDALYVHFRTGSTGNQYQQLTIRNVRVKELTDNAAVRVPRVAVPANAATTFRMGPTVAGSATPVTTLGAVALASGAQLNLAFETSAALTTTPSGIVGVEGLTTGNGSVLAAGDGVTLSVSNTLVCVGEPAAALRVSGSVRFADTFRIVVPRAWRLSRQKIRLLDLASASVVGALPSVTVVDENGNAFSPRYVVSVDAQGVAINFSSGFVMIVN